MLNRRAVAGHAGIGSVEVEKGEAEELYSVLCCLGCRGDFIYSF
jgi:hypothetical protein